MSVVEVELTPDGYVRLDAADAARLFPGDALVAQQRDDELWLLPLLSQQSGGLLLKQRNLAGDRAVLVHEALTPGWPSGAMTGVWDSAAGALRVALGGRR